MRLAVLLAALAALACRPEAPPDASYRALSAAVRARDADAAWDLLSSDTRAWLEARARAAAAAAPGVLPSEAKELLLGSASAGVRPPRSVVVLRESADRCLLQVAEEAGEPREVTLVRERGAWRVVLPQG
jgi:hypothetical protein